MFRQSSPGAHRHRNSDQASPREERRQRGGGGGKACQREDGGREGAERGEHGVQCATLIQGHAKIRED